jgi:hypothetical protein
MIDKRFYMRKNRAYSFGCPLDIKKINPKGVYVIDGEILIEIFKEYKKKVLKK